MTSPVAPPSDLRWIRWAQSILWPSFLMAGVLEVLVFALVDPAQMRWFGGPSLSLSNLAVYSLAFLVFWMVITLAGAMTALLINTPEVRQADSRRLPN